MNMSEELIQQELNSNNETNMSHSSLYNEIRILVESIESDVVKSEKGNKAASVRLRKALRLLKTRSGDFVKLTLGKI